MTKIAVTNISRCGLQASRTLTLEVVPERASPSPGPLSPGPLIKEYTVSKVPFKVLGSPVCQSR